MSKTSDWTIVADVRRWPAPVYEALLDTVGGADNARLVAVGDGSSGGAQPAPNVTLLQVPDDVGFSGALNAAVVASRSSAVVVLEAPCTIDLRSLQDGVDDAARTASVTLVSYGVALNAVPNREILLPVTRDRWTAGTALIFDRAAFLRIQGFDEELEGGTRACIDLAERLRRVGCAMQWREDLAQTCVSTGDSSPLRHTEVSGMEAAVKADLTIVRNLPVWSSSDRARPLVSVVIATRNRAQYLRDSVYSVLAQTFDNFELIVVDDGSEDATPRVLAEIADPRLRYIRQDPTGIAGARNRGADESRGFYTAVHDDDDIMLPWRLERGLETLQEGDQASYGAWVNFDDETAEMVTHVTREEFGMPVSLHNGQSPGHATWLIETELLRRFRYDQRMTSAVDHNLALRLMRMGVKWRHTRRVMFLRRMHPGQVSITDRLSQDAGAKLSRLMLESGTSIAAADRVRCRESEIRWPTIPGRSAPQQHFAAYLPDHLVERRVLLRGGALNKLVAINKVRDTGVVILERSLDGREIEESVEVEHVTLEDLARLRVAGIKHEVEARLKSEIQLSSQEDRVRAALMRVATRLVARNRSDGHDPVEVMIMAPDRHSALVAAEAGEHGAAFARRVHVTATARSRADVALLGFADRRRALRTFARLRQEPDGSGVALVGTERLSLNPVVQELALIDQKAAAGAL